MIKPTVGRVVWFHRAKWQTEIYQREQPLAAIVTHVHSDRMVNLAVFDANGGYHGITSVPLWQEGDPLMGEPSMYCEWMPYQKGQAAKSHAAEAAADASASDGPIA